MTSSSHTGSTARSSSYPIERVAGKGGDFERALRLCRWLAPRLKHKGDYDNHVPGNALALMEYCFEKPEVGINCTNKAKILAECYLALGICARRLWMFPLSPYDMDNHVVTEVFDRKRNKWIIVDPTTGGYFTDGESPLSALETRALYARHGQVSAVMNRQNPSDMEALMAKPGNLAYNVYYAKNFFRLCVETVSGFGKAEGTRYYNLLPVGVNLQRQEAESIRYQIDTAKRYSMEEGLIREMERIWRASSRNMRYCWVRSACGTHRLFESYHKRASSCLMGEGPFCAVYSTASSLPT